MAERLSAPALPSSAAKGEAEAAFRFLVIDDNPTDCELIAGELIRHFPEAVVVNVRTASELERAVAADAYDLVITDYELGFGTGTTVLRRVKASDAERPVIMFTASGSEEIAVAAMKEGLDDYLTKTPKHYGRLPYAVEHCLDRRRERRALEQALASARRERERLLAYLEGLPLFVTIVSAPELTYTFANRAFREFWGRKFVGELVRDASPSPRPILDLFERVLRQRSQIAIDEYEASVQLTDGRTEQRWYRIWVNPWFDPSGEISEILTATIDITLLVQERHAALETKQRILSYLDQLPEPVIFVAAPEWRVEFLNGAAREIGGDGLIGRPVSDLVVGAEELLPLFERVQSTGETVTIRGFEAHLTTHAPGPPRYWDASLQPWRDAEGRIEGLLVVATEVTAEVAARSEREALLERERAARVEAERINRAKDEFLALLGHELRNPLSPIRNAAQILRMSPDNPVRIEQSSAIIARQVDHMARLVDDLLDVSRVTRGLIELKLEPLEMKNIVAGAIEQSRPLIEQRHHTLDVEMPTQSMRVRGDRVRLVQVVANLLNNAAKYTLDGGEIGVTLTHESDMVVVRVRDNGVGISEELLPHIFELFTQAEQDADRSQGGLGLGLPLVKSLVSMHGGSVAAASGGPNEGSEFTIRLPRLLQEAAQRLAATSAASAPCAGLRVLVVDDNADAADSIGILLELAGHQVALAYDAGSALSRSAVEHFDVLVLDIGLPGIDGYELARRLRAMEGGANALVVALTGYGLGSDRIRSLEAGFDHHLVKPVDPAELLALLARFGDERRRPGGR